MKKIIIAGLIIGIILILIIVAKSSFSIRNNNGDKPYFEIAKQIQFSELETILAQLLDKKLEYDFFGITSDGIDCIYFVDTKGKINIEFEIMINEQKKFIESFNTFAEKNNYKISQTTYGNKPNYSDLKEAPVYVLELNVDKEKANEIGIKIMKEIFNKNESTKFDIVP